MTSGCGDAKDAIKTMPNLENRGISSPITSATIPGTGQIYLSCLDDLGRIIMCMSANQLMELKEMISRQPKINSNRRIARCSTPNVDRRWTPSSTSKAFDVRLLSM
jgi:hypothetical protein